MGGSSSQYVTMVGLVNIGIAMMEIVFFIGHVTSREHVTEFCEFMGGNPSWRVTTFPCLPTIRR